MPVGGLLQAPGACVSPPLCGARLRVALRQPAC